MNAAVMIEEPAVAPASFVSRAGRVLSPSQVNAFLDCQARWYYSHVAELPDPPTGSLALGKAVHHVARLLLLAKQEPELGTPSDAELIDAMAQALRVELSQAELRADEEAATLEADAIALIQLFAREVAPSIEAAALELDVHGLIGGQHVHGIVDVLTADGVIVDLKTAAKKPGEISASYRLQLATYGLLLDKRECRLITLVRTTVPKWTQHTLSLTEADARYAEAIYGLVAEAMDSGLYLPNRGSHLCSRKHCAFWRECEREYGGEVKA